MNILGYKEFDNILYGLNIVYVPIVSCINRQTGEYDLSCDGNVNRFVTTFSKCESFASLTIVLPKVHVAGSEKLVEQFANSHINIKLIYSEHFGIHAGEQRNMDSVVNAMYDDIKKLETDIYIFESQKLGKLLIENKKDRQQFIFYNPVSKVNGKSRVFLEGYDDINNWLFENSDYMIVSSPDQIKYFENGTKEHIVYLDKLIDRDIELFDYEKNIDMKKIIGASVNINTKMFYLPFRMTDEGYKMDTVLSTLYHEYKSHDGNIVVFYSDPNNSKILDKIKMNEKLKWKFVQVPTDRNTYYTLIDNPNITVLYYEDLDFINHAAIHEFISNKAQCEVWVMENNNPYGIMDCSRVKVNYYKPTLIVLEGQDQTGKDTLLDMICDNNPNLYWYKQKTHEETGTDYRKKNDYEAWLKDYIGEQLDELIEIGQEHSIILMTRLLISDNVYSDLFGRSHIVETYYKDKIYNNFNVLTSCLLWDTYDDYIKRISQYTNDVEYKKDEFEKTKNLYQKYVGPNDIIYIKDDTTRQQVIDKFKNW